MLRLSFQRLLQVIRANFESVRRQRLVPSPVVHELILVVINCSITPNVFCGRLMVVVIEEAGIESSRCLVEGLEVLLHNDWLKMLNLT